ncbi:MAG TPA: xanthine dehydrogenase family protein molybdopterin-binding subunit [Polyangiaceae bacterium]|nr:xanthine dehydrogenase family protein molybdopterin-binding subunit [Polyangiaceae bacterium]
MSGARANPQQKGASLVGAGIDRLDARLKVTGKAEYSAEVPVANIAHAVIVTSAIARGRVTRIDTSDAEAVPGVLALLTHENAPKLPGATRREGPIDRLLQLLQSDEILYNAQPIALAVADSLEHARAAADLVRAEYAETAPVVELAQARDSLYVPKTAGPRAEPTSERGDVERGLRAASARVDVTYTTPSQHHNPMEPHASIAVWQGNERLTVYDATQGIFGVRKKVATVFGLPPENVRVISHYVGGGFGCKGSPWSHIALCALAARATGRPVKLVLTRQQMFSLVGNRPRTEQHLELGADRQGKLLAMRHDVVSDTSRFDEFSEPSALQTRMLYACDNVHTSHRLVRVDLPTPTFTRAPGESSGTFALESAIDELAHELGMDPLSLRVKNYASRDPDENKPWSSKSLMACYEQAAARFGWKERDQAPRATRRGRHWIGSGMATATYPSRQSAASAIARLRPDGVILVQAGSQDIGTGTYTIMTQIAADALGVPLERVRFELGDTTFPETPISGGSQTAASTGSAVRRAALGLRDALIGLAVKDPRSPLRELPADALDVRDGNLVARDGAGPSGATDSFVEVLRRSGKPEISVRVDSPEKPERKQYSTHAFGAQFVEVAVDDLTREVRVTRVVSAFGAGKILNAKTARSQLIGGIVWGIGFALHEHTAWDARTGRAVTRDLADYHVPVHADIPDIDVIMVPEEDAFVNDLGAKGIGEIGITGVNAAIANAVFHATGQRVRDLPITPDKLL